MGYKEQALVRAASEVMSRAYAPYSKLKVGAAVAASSGAIYCGCNVENASYGLTLCAERVAVARAVVSGARRFGVIAVASSGREPVFPCGACLQVLAEFNTKIKIILVHRGRVWKRTSLPRLMPRPFTVTAK